MIKTTAFVFLIVIVFFTGYFLGFSGYNIHIESENFSASVNIKDEDILNANSHAEIHERIKKSMHEVMGDLRVDSHIRIIFDSLNDELVREKIRILTNLKTEPKIGISSDKLMGE